MTTIPARPKPIVPLLPYQLADIQNPARFCWNCWSRQTGKSFTKALRRLLRGIDRRRNQILLSAGQRQSNELMQKVRMHCQALAIAADAHNVPGFKGTRYTKSEIVLPGGVRIISLPANPQTARGFTGDVLLDEFAMHRDDRAIWASLFPTLLRGKGELDVASTPRGASNLFARLKENSRFHRSTLTLPQAVHQGLDVDIDTIRDALGDDTLYRQEFLCEFLDEASAFLTHEMITACQDPNLERQPPIRELAAIPYDLFVGVDVGRKHDLTVIWVLARQDRELVTRAVIELRDTPFRKQSERLAEILRLTRVRHCCIDAGGIGMQLAESAAETFGRHRVEGVTFTAGFKAQIAARLRIAVEDRAIRIPDDDAIRNDWHSVQRRVSPSGRLTLDAPRSDGHHADRFWAAALALNAVDGSTGTVEMIRGRNITFARAGLW